uniref:Reverse transcriptase domain-containing protein n=1 Tax=Tanacetum cinerariifolium TaxID=118510 RepID=A0A6L2MYY6_TANCI|nr:reverse transcriptase domain-containing protein [Tanacetum cinerariifolium]
MGAYLDFMPCSVTTLEKHVVEVDGSGLNLGGGFGNPGGGHKTRGGGDGLNGPGGQLSIVGVQRELVLETHLVMMMRCSMCSCYKWILMELVVVKVKEVVKEFFQFIVTHLRIRSGNDAHDNVADIIPIYNEEPMAEVKTTAEINVFAIGQQHTEQPKFNNEGDVVQNAEECHDTCPFPAILSCLVEEQRLEPALNLTVHCCGRKGSLSTLVMLEANIFPVGTHLSFLFVGNTYWFYGFISVCSLIGWNLSMNLGEPSSFFDFEEVMNNNHNQEPPPQHGPPPMVRPNGQAPRTMEELCQPSINERGRPIASIPIQATDFGLRHHMIQQVQNRCQFHGLPGNDANRHIDKFLEITQHMKQNGVSDDALRSSLFPYSLTHHAIAWYDRLPRNSNYSFDDMMRKFLSKYFFPSMVTKLRNEITKFEQKPHEPDISSTSTTESPEVVRQLEMMNKNFSEMMRQFQTIKAIDTKCETCGGHHSFTECPAIGGYTHETAYATTGNYNSGGTGSLPSNTVPNPREDLKVITTRSGVTLAGPSISLSSSSSKEVNREPETIIDQVLVGSTNIVSPLVVQPSPASASFSNNSSSKMLEVTKDKIFLLELTSTQMILELADRSTTRPAGIAEDIFVKVGKFHFPTDFVVVDYFVDPRVPLILRRPFLRTGRALIDVYGEELTIRVDDEAITFKVGQTSKYSYSEAESINRVDIIDVACEEYVQEVLGFSNNSKKIEACLTSELIPPRIDDTDLDLEGDIRLLEELLNNDPSLSPLPPKELNVEEIKTIKSSIDEPPELELKELSSHLEYAYLEGTNNLPVTIAKDLKDDEKEALLKVLKYHKWAIAWKISDIKGIDPRFCTHKILMQEDYKPTVQSQRRVNPKIYEVIKKEVIKLLYSILTVRGLEFDRAKVDVIAMLPHPTTVKGVRSFLGHAGFYRRFIQDFSKIARHMTHLLEKETPFVFSKDYIDAFETLQKKLIEAPILVVFDWNLHFELMCDASDFAIGAVLGQRKTKHFQPIHYAKDALWAFRTTYKTPIWCTPYKLVYGKSCHLPIELEHKAYWALKHVNFDFKTAGDHQKLQLNELNELCDQAYENYLIYKEKTKKLHDYKIKNRIFNVGDQVLLFNSHLKIFSGKLKTRWTGPFTIVYFFPYVTIELSQPDGPNFTVNDHRVKHYFGGDIPQLVVSDL